MALQYTPGQFDGCHGSLEIDHSMSPKGLKSAWVKGIGVIDRATSFSHFSPFNCAVSPSVPISAATKSPKR